MSVKISELTASSGLSSADIIPVVDNSDSQTQKATLQQVLNYITGSTFNNLTVTSLTGTNGSITGDLVVGGKLTAQEYHTEVVSASIIYESGSTKFGNDSADTHQFSGSMLLSGTLTANNTISGTTAQFTTISASSAEVSGNLVVNGAVNLAEFPDYAYVLYTASLDKIVVYPGLYVSGNLTGSGLGAFQTVSASSYLGLPTSSGGTPGGTNTTVQFNSGSTFSGSTNLIYNYTTNTLSGTTAEFTGLTSSVVDIPNYNINNSTLKVGSLEFQPYSLNNAWIGENVYYSFNNLKFFRRQAGSAGLFYFNGDEGQFRFHTSSGAGIEVPLISQFKVNANGIVALGGAINNFPGNYTGATLLVSTSGSQINGNTTISGNLTVTGVISGSSYLGVSGGGGDVTTTGSNTFTGVNTFNTNFITASVGITGSTAQFTTVTASNLFISSSGNAVIDVSSTNAALRITQRSTGESIRIEDSTNPDSTPFIIDANGNTGIGIASPDNLLHVHRGTAGSVTSQANSLITLENSSSAFLQILTPAASDGGVFFGSPATNIQGGVVYTHPTNTLQLRTGGNLTRLSINGAGDVGIGTSSPNSKLDVAGSTIISGNLTVTGSIFVSGSSIYGQVAELTSSTTNYTLVRQDSGKFLNVNSGSAVTVTVPTGLPTGFTVSLCQLGAGQVTVSGAVGVSINNRQSHTKTAGQYAVVSIVGTSANTYVFVGDTTL
jgi:hypothetical protein